MKKTLLLIISLIVLTSCQNSQLKKITVAGHQLEVEIADTTDLRVKGLSGRQSLAQNQGMLFVFENYSQPNFWMKGMKFPIDIIWVKDNTIVEITENVPVPESEPLPHYRPQEPVNYVLEVNAGWAKNNDIKIGDKIDIETVLE